MIRTQVDGCKACVFPPVTRNRISLLRLDMQINTDISACEQRMPCCFSSPAGGSNALHLWAFFPIIYRMQSHPTLLVCFEVISTNRIIQRDQERGCPRVSSVFLKCKITPATRGTVLSPSTLDVIPPLLLYRAKLVFLEV